MAGKMEEYVAQKVFALNFEDYRNIKSIKMLVGQSVMFDGDVAVYGTGDTQVKGRCRLRGAINTGWLKLKSETEPVATPLTTNNILTSLEPAEKDSDYNAQLGGNFDTHLKKSGLNMEIIRGEDRVVKTFDPKSVKAKESDLSVTADQVPVRDYVTSSTTQPKKADFSIKQVSSENYGADTSTPINKIETTKNGNKPKKTFIVDENTPLNIDREAPLKLPIVISESNQDGNVVGQIKTASEQVSVEGITMKQSKPRETSAAATVSKGEDTPYQQGEVRTIVPKKPPVEKRGLTPRAKPKADAPKIEHGDFMAMLPENWGDLTWEQKVSFINLLIQKEFIEFIQTCETTPAVVNACKERLKYLEQNPNGYEDPR